MEGSSGRDRILRAALRCFGAEGAAATTLTALRKEAGVSTGTFYHHFQSKEEVVGALFAESLALYQRAFLDELRRHPDPRDAVRGIVAFHVAWCSERREHARFLFSERAPRGPEPGGARLAAQNRDFFTEVLAWCRLHEHHGALRPLDFTTRHALWLGPAQEWCRLWLAGQDGPPDGSQVALLAESAWEALRAREA